MKNATVLFVDDEPNVLSALRRTLRAEPYRVLLAQGPDEGLTVLKDNEVDIIVSDHLMPSMDGLTFLRLVKMLYPGVVRIILTGHANLDMAIGAINEGEVLRFFTKPWNDVELRAAIQQIVAFIELKRENQVLMDTVRKQRSFIEKLEQEHPGLMNVERDESGAIVLDLEDLER
jgi:two-component system, probable response regulator PhcQ